MPRFKRARKSEPWAASRQERKRRFQGFLGKRFKPLVPEKSTPEKEFPGCTRLHAIEKSLPNAAETEDIVKFVIESIGKKAVVEFIRDNASYLGEVWLKGVNNSVFDPIIPIASKGHGQKGWTKDQRKLTRLNPYKLFQGGYKNLKPQEYNTYTVTCYLMIIYKMAEKEMPKIIANYRENAIALLEERGIPFDPEVIDEELKITSNKRAMRGGIGETPEKRFRDAERFFVQINKYERYKSQEAHKKANDITRNIAGQKGLKKTKPKDRRVMEKVSEELAGRILKNKKCENSSDKKRNGENNHEEKINGLEIRAKTAIGRELKKREKAMEEEKRARETVKAPQEKNNPKKMQSTQRQRHRNAEAKRIRDKRRKERESTARVKEETKATGSHSQIYRRMRRLKSEAPNVYQFIRKNRRTAGISSTVFEDLISKMLIYKLPRRATNEALKAGFEKAFPATATPTLVYILTEIGSLARRPSTVESRVKNRCQKLDCQSEFVKPVINFLLKKGVLKKHHAPSGQGQRISISRKFN